VGRVKSYVLLLVLAVTLTTEPARADDGIRVHQSGGISDGGPAGAPAFVTFDAGEPIVVRRITSESAAFATSNTGGTASAYADTSQALCTTPCTLELRAGFYRLRFGDYNPMNANKPIDFDLKPGTNHYRVSPFRGGKFISGFLLTLAGGTALIVGGSLGIINGDSAMYGLAAVGGGVTIGGIVMIAGSGASAEAVPVRDPSLR
jgi:hypothetical protein